MTKLYISNTSMDELKNLITEFGRNELELDEFEFFIRSFNIENTNDHLFECVFHEDIYDLFDIDQFIQSLNGTKVIGFSLFLPDGSPVFRVWDNGKQVANICEPDDIFEVSEIFEKLFPAVTGFEGFHSEVTKRADEGKDEMLVALMKEITNIDSSQNMSLSQEQLYSVSGPEVELIEAFNLSDYGDAMDINGTDFYYWC